MRQSWLVNQMGDRHCGEFGELSVAMCKIQHGTGWL
jgi:hypothetical protein